MRLRALLVGLALVALAGLAVERASRTQAAFTGTTSSPSSTWTAALAPQALWGAGDNASGQLMTRDYRTSPTRVGTDADWSTLAVGGAHACGVRTGQLYCWGRNGNGQLGDGTTVNKPTPTRIGVASDWVSVVAGPDYTCGIKAVGQVWCWGANTNGKLGDNSSTQRTAPVRVGANADWTSLSTGDNHTCGVRAGLMFCWGNGAFGTIGDGNTSNRTTPRQAGAATDWSKVSAGRSHTCATRTTGQLWCWGYNGDSEVGDGTTTQRNSPVRVGTETDWTAVGTGPQRTCGLRASELHCWGSNVLGGLGNGLDESTATATPTVVGTDADWTSLAVGAVSCATKAAGELWCWGGYNFFGEVGDGTTERRLVPTRVGSAEDWSLPRTTLSSNEANGSAGACAVRAGNQLWCWGDGSFGQVGQSYAALGLAKIAAAPWNVVEMGSQHACASRPSGTLWCWGNGQSLQLAVTPGRNSADPLQVGANADWTTAAAGAAHSCGLRNGGVAYCWGAGGSGRLGTNSTSNQSSPAAVNTGAGQTWAELAAGAGHTCARSTIGRLYCWGMNSSGQLGDNSTSQRLVPTRVGTDADWTAVSVDGDGQHTCGLRGAGELYCWGANGSSRLGDGTTTQRNVPTRIGVDADWTAVAAGSGATCGLKAGGQLWCWGLNSSGQVGDGTNTLRATPTRVGTDADWTAVAAGATHACGLKAGNTQVWCWGANAKGELGDGTTTNRNAPVQLAGSWPGTCSRLALGTGSTLVECAE